MTLSASNSSQGISSIEINSYESTRMNGYVASTNYANINYVNGSNCMSGSKTSKASSVCDRSSSENSDSSEYEDDQQLSPAYGQSSFF
jgi:hypothetical protein